MLQKLNERIQGVMAWVVIVLIAVTFTLFGVQSYLQTHQTTTAVVEVNGQPISKQQFQLHYQRLRQMRDPSTLTATADKKLQKQLLDELILSQVGIDSARSYGFDVSTHQADQAIFQIPEFQDKGQFSAERYQQALTSAMFTHESFQREVRQGMLLSQQRFAFMSTAFALKSEVQQFIKLYDQTRDYRYISITPSTFFNALTVSTDEVLAYYHAHAHAFRAPEQVSLEFVRLSMKAVRASIHLSEITCQRYYKENKNNYQMADGVVKPYADVRQEITDQLLSERAQAMYARALENLSDWSYQTPDSLTSVALKLKLPIEKTTLFSRQGGDSPVTQHRQVIQAAFSRDVLEQGNNSTPIQLDDDSVLVLRVNEHVPAKDKPFVDVATVVEQQVREAKAVAAAKSLGETLLHAHAEQRVALMQTHHLSWQSVLKATRGEVDHVSADINALAFSLPRASGSIAGRAFDAGHYVVVELQQVHDGQHNSALNKEHIAHIASQLESSEGVMDYDLYIKQLLSQAAIVKN